MNRCANFLKENQPDALISQNFLFWSETLHVSDSSSVRRQLFTVHTAMVYVIQVCWQLASRIRMFQTVCYSLWYNASTHDVAGQWPATSWVGATRCLRAVGWVGLC